MVLLGMLVVGVWAGAAGEGVAGAALGLFVAVFETEAAAAGAALAGFAAVFKTEVAAIGATLAAFAALGCELAGATVAGVPVGGLAFWVVALATGLLNCRPQLPQKLASALVGCWQFGQMISLAILFLV